MIRFGFTGTRAGMTERQRMRMEWLLQIALDFRHGDCVGADAEAHEIARNLGIPTDIHPPSRPELRAFCQGFRNIYPPKPYLLRNEDIVMVCDELIAVPGGMREEKRSGTWQTIRSARRRGVPIWIVWPNGHISMERR